MITSCVTRAPREMPPGSGGEVHQSAGIVSDSSTAPTVISIVAVASPFIAALLGVAAGGVQMHAAGDGVNQFFFRRGFPLVAGGAAGVGGAAAVGMTSRSTSPRIGGSVLLAG